MNRNLKLRTLLIVVTLVSVVISLFWMMNQQTQAVSIYASNEEQEVKAALERAYKVLATAYRTDDPNILSEVFIDHPDYRRAIGQEYYAKVQNDVTQTLGSDVAQNFGFLTAMKSRVLRKAQGRQLLKEALNKAQAEGRELTKEEMEELTKKNHGVPPSLPDNATSTDNSIFIEQYESVKIEGDKARVTYVRVIGRTAILVRIEGRWVVAGIF